MVETNCWLSMNDALAALVAGRAGFDSVTLDMQHGLSDEAGVVRALLALSSATPRRYVRPLTGEPGICGRLLDLGADGLIVPMVNSVAEAERLAAACHYPPRGQRSYGPVLSALREGAQPYTGKAENGPQIFAMIETRAALHAAADIAAVDGIAGLYVGPNDLGLALGLGPGSDREEPEALAALLEIAAAARNSGKRAGLFCASATYARRMAGEGFDLLTLTSDSAAMGRGLAKSLGEFRA